MSNISAPRGRDSIAQGGSPGYRIQNVAEALKGRDSSDAPGAFRIFESRPVGALRHVCSLTQGVAPLALGCRISPRWGCLAESRNKNRIQIELAANADRRQNDRPDGSQADMGQVFPNGRRSGAQSHNGGSAGASPSRLEIQEETEMTVLRKGGRGSCRAANGHTLQNNRSDGPQTDVGRASPNGTDSGGRSHNGGSAGASPSRFGSAGASPSRFRRKSK
jgi:hypothetical protein